MRICRFDDDRLGLVEGDEVVDVSAALAVLPEVRWPYPLGDPLITHWGALQPAIADAAATGPRRAVDAVRLRSPLTNPSKIIGIARNRRNLAQETVDPGVAHGPARGDGDPIEMFIKATSAIAGPSDGVRLRFPERRNDPEAELTVIIGRPGSGIAREAALDHVFGYCIGIDMTLRGPESMSSRKSIDDYAMLGPWIATRDEVPDPDAVATRLTVNGAVVQEANTRDLAFDVRSLVAHASTFFTLHPGDAIMVGTPAGFTQVHGGDMMEAEFSHIGRMRIAIRDR